MPGRALELALATEDIRRSFDFWARLGFGSALTGDAWPWPYGVLTAPRVCLALHETQLPSPQVVLVRPDIAALAPLLEERGVEVSGLRLGAEQFNELQFTDPSGVPVRVLEARTFSPPEAAARCLLGTFDAVSWPTADPEDVSAFWERLHTDCTPLQDDWATLRADLGGHRIAWHGRRMANEPLLVFLHPDLQSLRKDLEGLDVRPSSRKLGLSRAHLLLESPEGQKIAILA
jgi:hypothetical protein